MGYLKPQSVNYREYKNMCACLAIRQSKQDSITECLKEIHWLPIKQRIEFKILTLTHKCINNPGPKYLQDIISLRHTQT